MITHSGGERYFVHLTGATADGAVADIGNGCVTRTAGRQEQTHTGLVCDAEVHPSTLCCTLLQRGSKLN